MAEPIILPKLSHKYREVIEGIDDKMYLEDTYIRYFGWVRVEESEVDEEYIKKEKFYDYDFIIVKSAITDIQVSYNNITQMYQVIIDTNGGSNSGLLTTIESREKAKEIYKTILEWWLKK